MGAGRTSCVCYWGCGNTGNIVVWVTFAVSACLGAGLVIGGSVAGHDCFQRYQNCVDDGVSRDTCQTYANKNCNLNKFQGILGSGIIIFFFITPLITSYFCCCASRPLQPGQDGTGMVVIASAPVPPMSHDPTYPQQPGAYPYPYPPPPGYPGTPPPPGYQVYGQPYPTAVPPQHYPPMPGAPAGPSHNTVAPPVMGMPAKQL